MTLMRGDFPPHVARSAELNVTLPSRVNLAFGGSLRCREDAWLNDGAFVSTVRDGEAGYELFAGGSLGKAPQLAVHWGWAAALSLVAVAVLAGCGVALWRTTRFS